MYGFQWVSVWVKCDKERGQSIEKTLEKTKAYKVDNIKSPNHKAQSLPPPLPIKSIQSSPTEWKYDGCLCDVY